MKLSVMIAAILAVLCACGCTDREAEARRAKAEAEAKARAEAARREMEALPKAFKSRPFFKLNEPTDSPQGADNEPPAPANP